MRRLTGIVALAVLTILAPPAAADIRLQFRSTPDGWLTASATVPPGTTTVGVRTDTASGSRVEVAAGAGAFVELHDIGGHLTEPAWIGDARSVRVRIRGARSARLITVEAGPTAAPPRRRQAALAPDEPGVPRPEIVLRAGWKADESLLRTDPVLFDRLGAVFVHHTVSANGYGPGDVAAMLRGIQRYHVVGRGWTDIGYNYLVDRFGRVYEGRDGGITANVRGAQVAGLNTGSAGIALLGSYGSEAPTAAQLAALASLIAWRLDVAHVDPLAKARLLSGGSARFGEGTVVTLDAISGHRDGGFTECPGDAVYRRLPALRETVAGVAQLRIFAPRAGPATLDPAGGDGRIRFSAALSAPSPWTITIRDASGATVRTLTGEGGEIDAIWDGLRDAGTPAPPRHDLTWEITAGAARPAGGGFDDLAAAPTRDLIGDVSAHPTGGGDYELAWRQFGSARVASAIIGADGAVVTSLDPGTRRDAGRRTIRWAAAALGSGSYLLNLRVARADGIATITVPVALRRGVRAVRLSARVVNAKGPELLTLQLQRREAVPITVRAAGVGVADLPAAPPGEITVAIDAASLSDGRHAVRVRAETKGGSQLVVLPLLVDRTSPRLTGITFRSGILRGRLSEAATLETAGRRRSFAAGRIAWRVAAGRTVRVVDVAGNVAVRRVTRTRRAG